MKRKFLLAVMAIFAFVLFSNAQNQKPIFINAGNVERLSIAENMEIVLLQGSADESGITLNKEAADLVDVKVSNKDMQLSLIGSGYRNQKQIVFVYVNDLKRLIVGDNSVVKTRGHLNVAKLDLYVESGAYAYLVTNGKINAFPSSDGQIQIKHVTAPYSIKSGL